MITSTRTLLPLLVAVEVAAYLGLGIVSGNWFAPAELQKKRIERVGGATENPNMGFRPTPGWVQSAAIHPFVGFVEDPSISPWDITDFGFYEAERPL